MKLFVAFITYGQDTARYLPYFLPSLKKQTFNDFQIVAVDNSGKKDNSNISYIKKNYPDIDLIESDKNLGFAKAYNLMIEKAVSKGADYFLALNPDIIMEEDAIEKMISFIQKDGRIGALAPKILRWDFQKKQKTKEIDSCGLRISRGHRFSELNQGEEDKNDVKSKEIFGFTGAAVLFRCRALQDVAFLINNKKEYFDELMFMYKEDCDLSYRLNLAGWKIFFYPEAVFYHDRTAKSKGENNIKVALNRRNKSRQVKKWSFLNQWILVFRYFGIPYSFKVKRSTFYYQLKSFIFAFVFEIYLIKELYKLLKFRKELKIKKKQHKIRTKIKDMEKIMS